MSSNLDYWLEYVDALVWQRRTSQTHGTLDQSAYCAFLRAASLEVEAERVLEEVAARIRDAGVEPPRDKLERQLEGAYAYVGANPGEFYAGDKPPKATYEPEKLARVASKLEAAEVGDDYFIARSPYTTWNRSPAGFLHKLYREGERVIVFDEFKSQGCGRSIFSPAVEAMFGFFVIRLTASGASSRG
jgi:hypothetical protein